MKSIHTIISRVHVILNGKRNESPATNQTENLWKKCFSRMAGVLALLMVFLGSVKGQSYTATWSSGSTGIGWVSFSTWGSGVSCKNLNTIVPSGATNISVTITMTSIDFDLYVNNGTTCPAGSVFTCRPFLSSTNSETCSGYNNVNCNLNAMIAVYKAATGSGSVTITVSWTPPPTTPINLTICQQGSGNISVTAPTLTSSQNVAFNIATEPTETNAAPGNQIATATISALPTGTTVTSAALTVNNLTALGYSFMSDVRLGLSGAVTYAAEAGSSTVTAGGFNYSSSVTSGITVGSGTSLNLLYWDYWDDNFGAECTFGAPKAANLTLNYSYPATINWYSAATGGTLLGTGASFNPIGTSVLLNTNTAGTYNFYAASSNNGCESSRVLVTVTVTTAPNAGTISGTQAICSNGTTTFSSNGNSGGAWTSGSTNYATIHSTSGVITPVAAGTSTITYTVTGTGGCSNATTTRTVTVTTAPNAGTISGTQAICSNGTTTFSSNGNSGGAWTSGSTNYATIHSTSGVITPVAAGTSTITYTITGTGGCSNATATRTVTVTTAPNAGTISGTQAICSNGTTTFSSNGNSGGAWTSSDQAVATINSTSGVITPVAAGSSTITYTITGTGGCSNATATSSVTVTAANTAAAASSTPTLCINTALTNITHTTTGATGIGTATSLPTGVSAAWSSNTITISGTPTASGTFNYIIPLTGGCGGINATGTITVTTNTAAAASSTPTLCINTVLTNITHATTDATGIGTATGLPAGVSAAWASNTITISGTPSASGVFGYSIPLSGGCGSVNATGTITVSPPTVAGSISAASSSVCSGTGTTLTLSGNTGTIEWQSSTDNVTYGTISGATTSSLSTGNLTQTKYFKALVSSGTCSAASTSVQVITIYANGTYIGPSTGNWNDAANWCGGLPSNATNVVISSGDVVTLNINAETTVATMTINGSLIVPSTAQLTVIGLLTNNGTFTLKDGATFIQGTSGTSITGNGTFNVEKALADNSSTWTTTSGRFWYMGVPMVNVVRSGYGTTGTTTNRVWSYAESTKSYTELTDGNALLSAGTGYVHRRSTDGTITFSAIGADGLYRSDVNISGLTRTTGTSAGYHLVSNPYMAYLDWYSVTKTNIEPTFYIRTNNTTNSNISALISYNSETNLSTNTSSVTATTQQLRYIAPLQSIWVRVGTAAATGSLAMTRGMLSHQTGNVGLKSSTVFPTLARVNLVDGNNFDQLLVYLNSDMSNEVDQYDSEKMLSSGTVQVYTMSSNKKLVMNGLKNNKKKVSVPLYLELPETKSYTLQLSEYMMEDGLILLEDKQEGTLQDFTINENYSFFANSGLLQNRFVLHFILPNAELTTQGPSNSWVTEEGSYTEGGDVEIFNDDRGNIQITVNQPEDHKVEGNVSVTDMNGKEVFKGQLDGITTNIELNVPSGIYYLTVQSGTLIEKKKVFIQD